MSNINELLKIASDLKLDDVRNDIEFLQAKMEQPNKDIIIPLVGEFSSGKTSLINALTDSKQLEVASKPTTATIYEVRFGADHCYAEIYDANTQLVKVEDDIKNLTNSLLQDTNLVRVYDTSTKINKSIVLVDTPGLSSNEPKHKIALTSYLPEADAIFVVTDVNQQITRSLIDFVNSAKLVERPIFLIITKCDTKTKNEVENVRKYILENIKLPIENIVCVSASSHDLGELFALLDKLQVKKNEIVDIAIKHRLKQIAVNMSNHIDNLLKSSSSDKELDDRIYELQGNLERISRNIDKLIRDASNQITEKADEIKRKFHDQTFTRLDGIVQQFKGADCDKEVYSAVNIIAQMSIQQYKKDIQYILLNLARERQRTVNEVPLQILESLDLSGVVLNQLSYNLDLASLGHQYDKIIGTTVKVTAAIAAVAGAAYVAGSAATAATSTAAKGTLETAKVADTVIDVADTATDVASIASNMKTQKMMRTTISNASEKLGKVTEKMNKVDEWSKDAGDKVGSQQGIIETSISWITDKMLGKPQRRRAITNYIEGTLIPEFALQLDGISSDLTRTIGELLHKEAQNNCAVMEQSLKELKTAQQSEKEQFKEKINRLNEYKTILKNV